MMIPCLCLGKYYLDHCCIYSEITFVSKRSVIDFAYLDKFDGCYNLSLGNGDNNNYESTISCTAFVLNGKIIHKLSKQNINRYAGNELTVFVLFFYQKPKLMTDNCAFRFLLFLNASNIAGH